MTKREGDGSLDRGACARRIPRPHARASPSGHRLCGDPAGVMRGRDGAGERKAGARRKGVIRGLVFRTFSFPICVGFVKESRGGWVARGGIETRAGGSRVAAGAIRLRPKVSAAKFTHARNPRGVSHRDGPIRTRVSRFGSSPVLTVWEMKTV